MMQKSSKPVLGGAPRNRTRRYCAEGAGLRGPRKLRLIRAEKLIAEAAEGGTDLIVFPEVWLSGYPYWTEGWDSPLQAMGWGSHPLPGCRHRRP